MSNASVLRLKFGDAPSSAPSGMARIWMDSSSRLCTVDENGLQQRFGPRFQHGPDLSVADQSMLLALDPSLFQNGDIILVTAATDKGAAGSSYGVVDKTLTGWARYAPLTIPASTPDGRALLAASSVDAQLLLLGITTPFLTGQDSVLNGKVLLYLRGYEINGVNPGGGIDFWYDESGYGRNGSSAGALNKPVYVTDAQTCIGNQPCVSIFGGIGEEFELASPLHLVDFTFFAVVKDTFYNEPLNCLTSGNGTCVASLSVFIPQYLPEVSYQVGVTNYWTGASPISSPVTARSPMVLEVSQNDTANTLTIKINGDLIYTGPSCSTYQSGVDGDNNPVYTSAVPLTVDTIGGNGASGIIAEMLVLDGTVTEAQRNAIRHTLGGFYKIPVK